LITAHQQSTRAGVLLINLGTPDDHSPAAIRRYLREFLSDRRVVDLPRALWWPVLNAFILPLRPRRLSHAYESVWQPEGAPLLVYSQRVADRLQEALSEAAGKAVPVRLAMRYGNPSIPDVMQRMESEGIRRIVLIPMYPQYSATTTATAIDAIGAVLSRSRWIPELRTINSYHDDPAYIAALAASVREHWAEHGRGEHLMMSFHGIPQRYFRAGDPYYCHCQKTARLLAEALQMPADGYTVCFQSRFGREPWLSPYTDQQVTALATSGVKTLDVICPGFSADCLETLEEIAMQNRDTFVEAGGAQLRYIAALNDRDDHVAVYRQLAMNALTGWLADAEGAEAIAARQQRVAAAEILLNG
jgi:ferrochelatase